MSKEAAKQNKTVITSQPGYDKQWQITFDAISDPIVILDKDCVIEQCNQAYARFINKPADKIIGKTCYALVHEADYNIQNCPFLRSKESCVREEMELPIGDKSFLVVVDPIFDASGQFDGAVHILQDVTEKKRLIEAAQNTQKLESLGILAGGIAHDFNNLLTGIFGYINLALATTKEQKTKGYLENSMQALNRARDLTQQLVTFARGGAPVKKSGDLFPLVQDAAQFTLSGSNISCNYTIDPALWPVNYDENQIAQVISNIVINAQQAMPRGGTIQITAENILLKEHEKGTLAKGRYVKLSIRDSGIGMPKEMIPHIFDPFFTTKSKGHGLGLATCYSIITRHEGLIEAESEAGKGSSFHIFLPAAEEKASLSNKEKPATLQGHGTILVMDDEETLRNLMRDMLESQGYSVICTENGSEAVSVFSKAIQHNKPITAMIFDLTIPGGMGGKEAVVEIRKLDKKIPVFVASGYASDPVMSNPNGYGFTASIKKPFVLPELAAILQHNLKN